MVDDSFTAETDAPSDGIGVEVCAAVGVPDGNVTPVNGKLRVRSTGLMGLVWVASPSWERSPTRSVAARLGPELVFSQFCTVVVPLLL